MANSTPPTASGSAGHQATDGAPDTDRAAAGADASKASTPERPEPTTPEDPIGTGSPEGLPAADHAAAGVGMRDVSISEWAEIPVTASHGSAAEGAAAAGEVTAMPEAPKTDETSAARLAGDDDAADETTALDISATDGPADVSDAAQAGSPVAGAALSDGLEAGESVAAALPGDSQASSAGREMLTPVEIRLRETFADARRSPDPTVDPMPAVRARIAEQRRRFRNVAILITVVVLALAAVPAVVTWLTAVPTVSRSAPAGGGLLPWPARGDHVDDERAIADALRVWNRHDDSTPAVSDVHLVYAGTSSLGTIVVLQGHTASGQPVVGTARYAAGGALLLGDHPIPSAGEPVVLLPAGLASSQLLLAPRLSGPRIRVALQAGIGTLVEETVAVDRYGRTPAFGLFETPAAYQIQLSGSGGPTQITAGVIRRGAAFSER